MATWRRGALIYYDFAEAYAIQGRTREALENLKRFADLFQDSSVVKMLEQNRHFDSLRGEPSYREVLARARYFEHPWDSAALNTGFRNNLPHAEKLAGLSKFWSEVKYNFGYPEKLVELDARARYGTRTGGRGSEGRDEIVCVGLASVANVQ